MKVWSAQMWRCGTSFFFFKRDPCITVNNLQSFDSNVIGGGSNHFGGWMCQKGVPSSLRAVLIENMPIIQRMHEIRTIWKIKKIHKYIHIINLVNMPSVQGISEQALSNPKYPWERETPFLCGTILTLKKTYG